MICVGSRMLYWKIFGTVPPPLTLRWQLNCDDCFPSRYTQTEPTKKFGVFMKDPVCRLCGQAEETDKPICRNMLCLDKRNFKFLNLTNYCWCSPQTQT